MNEACGLPIVLTIAVFCVMCFACALNDLHAKQGPQEDRAQIIAVFTMDGCGPCSKLEAYMKLSEIKTTVTITHEQPAVESFPTVFYSLNGNSVYDNGERIYEGRYWLPAKPVTRVHWATK